MKQYLPYNVLLVIAVALTGLMALYNLALRETFAVTVAYTMPAAPAAQTSTAMEALTALEPEESQAGFFENSAEDEPALSSVTFPLDINRATEAQLQFIPQIGNVTAQRIVQYRDVIGGYTSLEQLKEIKSIGDATFEKISAYLIIAN